MQQQNYSGKININVDMQDTCTVATIKTTFGCMTLCCAHMYSSS